MKAFWLGVGVGVGLGILTAPKSGEETRNELWQRIRQWRGSAQKGSSSQVSHEKAPGSQSGQAASDEVEGKGKSSREATHDKTLADSFPTSDPPSSIPDPSQDESAVAS
jgi:gas vesicle protein